MQNNPGPYAREASSEKLQPVATSPNVFVIADLHFGDEATCANGRRPFHSAAEMDQELVRRWNKTVQSSDTVYVLGDIGRTGRLGAILCLHGRKHLIAGNCDDLQAITHSGMFASVKVARTLRGFLLTHIPVHPSQLQGRMVNVHGHLHAATVGDPRDYCVSVEQTDYTPVLLDSLTARSEQGALL